MPICDADSSVPDWIVEYPETQPVFDEFRIDCSCGGRSLKFICLQQGLEPDTVLSAVCRAIAQHRGTRVD